MSLLASSMSLRWPRSYQKADREHFSLRINDILGLLTETSGADVRSFEPAQRMDDLGRRLESLGQRKPRDFRNDVSDVLLSYLEQYVAYMEEILERNARTPRIWVDDVTAHLEAVQTYTIGQILRGSRRAARCRWSLRGRRTLSSPRHEIRKAPPLLAENSRSSGGAESVRPRLGQAFAMRCPSALVAGNRKGERLIICIARLESDCFFICLLCL